MMELLSVAQRFLQGNFRLPEQSSVSMSMATTAVKDMIDEATYKRLEKDVTAVKSDIAALTDQITDALNTFAGVDVFLDGDFVGSVLFIETAHPDVEPFGVFPEDHEPDIVGGHVAQRGVARVQKLGGAGVDEQVQLEAQA